MRTFKKILAFTERMLGLVMEVGNGLIAGLILLGFLGLSTSFAKAQEFPDPATLSFVDAIDEVTVVRQSPGSLAHNLKWLTEVIYFESRGESTEHQRLVAEVVLNRVSNPGHPASIEEVVRQNEHIRNGCQFSYRCDGIAETIADERAWMRAITTAVSTYRDWVHGADFGCALYYRAYYTTSKRALKWFATLKKQEQHGTHIFYCDPEV
jgi:spore germination cell wall hydrolase CwlJ-like protein